jgi:hypothetical protein
MLRLLIRVIDIDINEIVLAVNKCLCVVLLLRGLIERCCQQRNTVVRHLIAVFFRTDMGNWEKKNTSLLASNRTPFQIQCGIFLTFALRGYFPDPLRVKIFPVRTYQGKHVPLLFNIQLRFSLKLLKI